MVSWPVIKVKIHTENFTRQQMLHVNIFWKKDGQVFQKQETWDIVVLELNNVLDKVFDSLDLIIF